MGNGVETSLYPPVKRFLESFGYAVKGEIGRCDLVGLKGDKPTVVVVGELKLAFNLELILQGVDRMTVADEVWLAARLSARGKGRESDRRYRNLCRSLGFGLLGVSAAGHVEVIVSPAAPPPRRNARRRSHIVDEHKKRRGDPAAGGSTRTPVMTAYRQQALACAAAMAAAPQRPRDLKRSFPDAPKILGRNVYGWFARIDRGVYGLTDSGRAALSAWGPALDASGDAEKPASPFRPSARDGDERPLSPAVASDRRPL